LQRPGTGGKRQEGESPIRHRERGENRTRKSSFVIRFEVFERWGNKGGGGKKKGGGWSKGQKKSGNSNRHSGGGLRGKMRGSRGNLSVLRLKSRKPKTAFELPFNNSIDICAQSRTHMRRLIRSGEKNERGSPSITGWLGKGTGPMLILDNTKD